MQISRGRSLTEQVMPPVVPAGLPSELLQRRPDVVQAEQGLAAATARIGMAKADRFPKLSITGILGIASPQLSRLVANETFSVLRAPAWLDHCSMRRFWASNRKRLKLKPGRPWPNTSRRSSSRSGKLKTLWWGSAPPMSRPTHRRGRSMLCGRPCTLPICDTKAASRTIWMSSLRSGVSSTRNWRLSPPVASIWCRSSSSIRRWVADGRRTKRATSGQGRLCRQEAGDEVKQDREFPPTVDSRLSQRR